jgi:hypothetical protein
MERTLEAVAQLMSQLVHGWLGACNDGAAIASPKATSINAIAKPAVATLTAFTLTSTLHVIDYEPSNSGLVCEIGFGMKCGLWVSPVLRPTSNWKQ